MNPRPLLIFLLAACSAGCTQQRETELAASATAETLPDGSIQVRKSTALEQSRVEDDAAKIRALDARYPSAPTPLGAPTERVTQISVPGILQLDDGRTVRLDGVRCDSKAVDYLRRLLSGEGVSVVVMPSGENLGEPIPADVWSVSTIQLEEPKRTSQSYSKPIETAITSGWCEVEATPTCKYNERYAALAAAFHAPAGAR